VVAIIGDEAYHGSGDRGGAAPFAARPPARRLRDDDGDAAV